MLAVVFVFMEGSFHGTQMTKVDGIDL